jgi:hypothetical protein
VRYLRSSFDEKYTKNEVNGCWEWHRALTGAGYGNYWAHGKWILAHRFAWERLHGPIPEGLHACHRCDNRKCVNPEHLFLGSQLENIKDMDRKGRRRTVNNPLRGEAHQLAKVTEKDVLRIRALWAGGGLTQRSIAKEYGLSFGQTCRILKGQRWAHLA